MHNAQRTMHHDYPRIFIVIAAMIVICLMIGTGLADGSVTLSPGEDWVWTRGAYNTFTGEIDLSAFIGQEVTLVMGTNLKYDPEKEEKSSPVFTSVNGKRLTMMKQSASVQVTVDEAGSITRFTGSLLPTDWFIRMTPRKRSGAISFSSVSSTQRNLGRRMAACFLARASRPSRSFR